MEAYFFYTKNIFLIHAFPLKLLMFAVCRAVFRL